MVRDDAHQTLKYRPEIDGLRALAIFPIVLFHAHIPGFSGGYVGVDIFFVISGFLITSLVLADIGAAKFSFSNFYERRIRRLLPPLVPVLLFTIIASFLLMGEEPFRSFVHSVWGTIGLVSNWVFLADTGYFSGPSEAKPLLHMWSLSIEEQFYILFPAALVLLSKYANRFKLALLTAVLVVSFIYALYLLKSGQADAAFFNSFARIWELLVGVCLALIMRAGWFSQEKLGVWAPILRCLGLAAIAGSVIFFTPETVFPGLWALPPVLGTALLILAGRGSDPISYALTSSPLVALGKISYAFYLWHWPLLVFSRLVYPEGTLTVSIIAVLIALIFSILSYFIVESPIRNRRAFPTVRMAYMGFAASIIGLVAISAAGMVDGPVKILRLTHLYGSRTVIVNSIEAEKQGYYKTLNLNYTHRMGDFDPVKHAGYTCSFDYSTRHETVLACVVGQAKEHNIVVFGDSVGRDTYHALRRTAPDKNVIMVHQSSCVPAEHGNCFKDLKVLVGKIQNSITVDWAVLAFRYRPDEWMRVEKNIEDFTSTFENVALFGVAPVQKINLGEYIMGLPEDEDIPKFRNNAEGELGAWDTRELAKGAQKLARNHDLHFVNTSSFFCEKQKCRLWIDEDYMTALFWDIQHLTPTAVKAYGQYLSQHPDAQIIISGKN